MKKEKLLLATGALLLSVSALVACSQGGKSSSSGEKVFSYLYYWSRYIRLFSVNKQSTSEFTGNAEDGLLEVDQYGNLISSLAKDWSVSKDGLTYTYKLRKGVKWVTAEGKNSEKLRLKTLWRGFNMLRIKSLQALYLVQKSVKGLDDYVSGKSKDFSTVGVKAIDDYTVEYTLNQPESFWNSKTTMGILMPVNKEFLDSKEGDDYSQGTNPSSILYCGPYLIKSITSKSVVTLEKNPSYWDADNVKISKVKLTYYDGQDSESLIRGFDNGDFTVARVFPNGSNYKSVEKKHKDDIVFSDQGCFYL